MMSPLPSPPLLTPRYLGRLSNLGVHSSLGSQNNVYVLPQFTLLDTKLCARNNSSIIYSHNIIQIHNNVLRDWQYHVKNCIIHLECEEGFAEHCQSHKTLLWIWLMLQLNPAMTLYMYPSCDGSVEIYENLLLVQKWFVFSWFKVYTSRMKFPRLVWLDPTQIEQSHMDHCLLIFHSFNFDEWVSNIQWMKRFI